MFSMISNLILWNKVCSNFINSCLDTSTFSFPNVWIQKLHRSRCVSWACFLLHPYGCRQVLALRRLSEIELVPFRHSTGQNAFTWPNMGNVEAERERSWTLPICPGCEIKQYLMYLVPIMNLSASG